MPLRRRALLALAGAIALDPLACAGRQRPAPRLSRLAPGLTLAEPPDAAGVGAFVRAHHVAATGRIRAFGLAPPAAVLIAVHHRVDDFVAATGQTAPWIRAYAQYARIDFLAPTLWSDSGARAQRQKLTHELWHVATFHALGNRRTAQAARLPFWLLEGSASVVADQADRRVALTTVHHVDDALRRPPRDHLLRYGAAHHTCAHLVKRHGDDVFARLFVEVGALTRGGAPHPVEEALHRLFSTSSEKLWDEVVSTP